ncbi:MAG TPA: sulfatase, partial [Thermoanaerobaculia bacterium]|nr:sulfatase [Thermoanaerobaculia bacterium]
MARVLRAFRRLPGVLLLALLAAAPLACSRPEVVRYDDLLAAGWGGPEPRQLYCGEEYRFARPLEDGDELAATVELGTEPSLALATCRPGGQPGVIEVEIAAEGEAPVTHRLGAHQPAGWQPMAVDLDDLAGRRVRVRLRTEMPSGGTLLLSEAFLAGRHRAPPLAEARGPQILLVSVDTLRADAVGALAGIAPELSPTPALDRLVAEGEVFSPHRAGASWTKPSHATLLTGYPETVHRSIDWEDPIHPAVPTLAERLRDAGLATAGTVHDCVWLQPKFGFDRGFASYRSEKWGTGEITRAAANWMADHRDRPFFFFLHTFQAHSDFHHLPYEGSTPQEVRSRFGVADYGCRDGDCASTLLERIDRGEIAPLPGEPEILEFLYRAGVSRTDAELGRLLDDLRTMGLYDDMTIVLTSDHGEMLLEHGRTLHGTWWEETLAVPLVVKWPRGERAGRRTTSPTSAVDLAPTLLAVAGVAAEGLPGRDLRAGGRRPAQAGVLWKAVYLDELKAVFGSKEGDLLFDLAADPREAHDLAAERPQDLERLRDLLAGFEERDRRLFESLAAGRPSRGDDAALTAEERERLRSL